MVGGPINTFSIAAAVACTTNTHAQSSGLTALAAVYELGKRRLKLAAEREHQVNHLAARGGCRAALQSARGSKNTAVLVTEVLGSWCGTQAVHPAPSQATRTLLCPLPALPPTHHGLQLLLQVHDGLVDEAGDVGQLAAHAGDEALRQLGGQVARADVLQQAVVLCGARARAAAMQGRLSTSSTGRQLECDCTTCRSPGIQLTTLAAAPCSSGRSPAHAAAHPASTSASGASEDTAQVLRVGYCQASAVPRQARAACMRRPTALSHTAALAAGKQPLLLAQSSKQSSNQAPAMLH